MIDIVCSNSADESSEPLIKTCLLEPRICNQ
jgi:hypothetical protein